MIAVASYIDDNDVVADDGRVRADIRGAGSVEQRTEPARHPGARHHGALLPAAHRGLFQAAPWHSTQTALQLAALARRQRCSHTCQ